MKQIDVSIIIVNYHTSDQVRDCIDSIYGFTSGVTYEIIIVDNNSEPNLSKIFDGYRHVSIISLPENIGFGQANNEGFKAARGRYLFCLNPDTILLNNAVRELATFMDTHPESGATGGNLYNTDMKPTLSFRRILPGIKWEINEFLNLKPEKMRFGKNRIFNHTGQPMEVAYITGADLMLRRETIEQTGGYDPAFFMYYEETDLCNRIKRTGWKIYSVPTAKIQHLEGGSFSETGGVSFSRIERAERGRRTYYKLNICLPKRIISNIVYLSTLITRSFLLKKSSKRDAWRHKLKLFFR